MAHDFDLAFLRVGGVALYWYGAIYTVGFLGLFAWFRLRRGRLGLGRAEVLDLVILLAAGMLIGGRIFDISVYERDYYEAHPWQALDWWRGGMATHGVLFGGLVAAAIFTRWKRMPLLLLLDEIVVPGVFLMAVGRLGNFIEGGVIGTVTTLPWGVTYADLEGPRHPVALYDAAKNLALVPVLAWALARFGGGSGVATALFLLLYAGLRFLVDLTRDYESVLLGLGPGQVFNLAMAAAGLVLLLWFLRRPRPRPQPRPAPSGPAGPWRAVLFAFLVLYPRGIPTSWTEVNIEAKRAAEPETNRGAGRSRETP